MFHKLDRLDGHLTEGHHVTKGRGGGQVGHEPNISVLRAQRQSSPVAAISLSRNFIAYKLKYEKKRSTVQSRIV